MAIKTLHITNAYHAASGGISTFYRALMETANRLGRRMILVVPAECDEVENVGEFGRIYHLRSPRSPFFDKRYRLLLPHTYLLRRSSRLIRILREESPDLLEICDKYSVCWLAGMLRRGMIGGLRRPVLVGMSCERMDDNVRAFISDSGLAKRFSKACLGNLYIPLFDYHIANSLYTAEELDEAMKPRHIRPVTWRPMGADASAFESATSNDSYRAELLRLCGGRPDTRLLLYAGRLSPEKNLPLLVETMESLLRRDGDRYRLLIAGDGPRSEWLRGMIETRLSGKGVLLGHVGDRRKLAELYANSDVFIHPNPNEPFGIAPLEAMAAGIPLVGPESGGLLAYADETNAWLTTPSGDRFAEAIQSVFTDRASRDEKLARARIVAHKHEWTLIAPQFFELYDDIFQNFPMTRFAEKSRNPGQAGAASIIPEERR